MKRLAPRLVPCALVSANYTEQCHAEMKTPKFFVTEGCVFNTLGKGGIVLSGEAYVETLSPDQVSMMQYVEYRRYAVESS